MGSTLTVTEFGDHTKQIVAQVAGVWQQRSANDPYWNGLDFNPDDTSPAVFPVPISTSDFFGTFRNFTTSGCGRRGSITPRLSGLTGRTAFGRQRRRGVTATTKRELSGARGYVRLAADAA